MRSRTDACKVRSQLARALVPSQYRGVFIEQVISEVCQSYRLQLSSYDMLSLEQSDVAYIEHRRFLPVTRAVAATWSRVCSAIERAGRGGGEQEKGTKRGRESEREREREREKGTKLKVNGGRGGIQGRVSASCCSDALIAVFLSFELSHFDVSSGIPGVLSAGILSSEAQNSRSIMHTCDNSRIRVFERAIERKEESSYPRNLRVRFPL